MMTIGAKTLVAGLGLIACACSRGPRDPAQGMQGLPPATVRIQTAHTANIEDASEYVATLKSLHSTTIQPQVEGQITQIFVRSGDRVPPGAPIMQIDPRRQQAAVSSQEAEVAARDANVAYAQQQAQRASQLYAAGAISAQEEEQAQTALKTAQADLESLRAQVRQQQVQLRYYTVAAPTAGIVGDIPVRVGAQVATTTLLTTIDQNETLEVYVSIPAERARELKRGVPIEILSGDGLQQLAATTIDFVSPHVDNETQSILVKGLVRNPDAALRASQFVRARVVWKTAAGLVIPVTAVLRLNGQDFAFVAEESHGPPVGIGGAGSRPALVARQRPIRLGAIVGNDYAVLGGIRPDDRVVVSGVQKLADGAPIQPEA
jgi:RND family efflux transporter MFP subunit